MSEYADQSDRAAACSPDSAAPLPPGLLSRYPWLTFLLPFLVYMGVGSLEPSADGDVWLNLGIEYRHYPFIYTAKIVLTVVAIIFVLPGYRTFRFHVGPLGPLVGVLGGVAWIVLSQLHLEAKLLDLLGLGGRLDLGERPAFNPLEQLSDTPAWAYGFLAIRLLGLVVVVAVIEEFFLRGFLMRMVVAEQWWTLSIGQVNRLAIVAGTVIPMLYHPELVAALVWFSAVTWLMLKTKNIWDCITAHAVTNCLLGVYVLTTGEWGLM